jgi:calcineurin-like phosphoesterase family protein
MTRDFIISDPHWNAKNVMRIPVRKEWAARYHTTQGHDQALVDNWNSVVTKRDNVYLLGDIGYDKPTGYLGAAVFAQLLGTIIMVGGNHDTAEVLQYGHRVHGVISKSVAGYRVIMTHIPIHPQEMFWDFNLHGHLHGGTVKKKAFNKDMKDIGEVDLRYINVCCEHMNYTPQLLETVVADRGKMWVT